MGVAITCLLLLKFYLYFETQKQKHSIYGIGYIHVISVILMSLIFIEKSFSFVIVILIKISF